MKFVIVLSVVAFALVSIFIYLLELGLVRGV